MSIQNDIIIKLLSIVETDSFYAYASSESCGGAVEFTEQEAEYLHHLESDDLT